MHARVHTYYDMEAKHARKGGSAAAYRLRARRLDLHHHHGHDLLCLHGHRSQPSRSLLVADLGRLENARPNTVAYSSQQLIQARRPTASSLLQTNNKLLTLLLQESD